MIYNLLNKIEESKLDAEIRAGYANLIQHPIMQAALAKLDEQTKKELILNGLIGTFNSGPSFYFSTEDNDA